MTVVCAHAIVLTGLDGHVARIEAGIGNGPVALLLEGRHDTALRETRDRVRAAIINSQHAWLSAGPLHVRRVRREPLGDLLQLHRELVLADRLALPPLPVLVPDRPPPIPLLPRRIHSDPARHLNHRPLVASGDHGVRC
jgi:hypothetical protein